MQRLPITELPHALIEAGYGPVSYRAIYTQAVNGAAWARRGSNGRWTWAAEDLGQIAKALQIGQPVTA